MSEKREGILGGALLICLGIIFLLNNFGILSWSIWGDIWKFWPVVLIILGISFLFRKA